MVGVVLPDAYLDPLCTQCMMQTQDSGRQHAQLSHKWPEPSGEFDEDERLPFRIVRSCLHSEQNLRPSDYRPPSRPIVAVGSFRSAR
jgi:hypothetical protein